MIRTSLGIVLLALTLPVFAVPTTVTVRAVSRDAKVIGTGVGGARITIRDAASGAVLAQGTQLGGTGDTEKIMVQPHERYGNQYDTEGTAAFVATIDIDVPTLVEVTAEAPLKFPHAVQRSSKSLLLVPGQHITGEGLLLEVHGFIIDFREVSPDRIVMWVAMTCGCPIEPGGLWDAGRITMKAELLRDGSVVAEAPVTYAGERSMFTTAFPEAPAGSHQVRVVASDADAVNFGTATTDLVVRSRESKDLPVPSGCILRPCNDSLRKISRAATTSCWAR